MLFQIKYTVTKSSLGTFLTKKTYYGGDGYSLTLHGLEKGFNDHAEVRHTMMHGAWYASEQFVNRHGYLGHSLGCLAMSKRLARPIIDTIKGGSIVFAYYPDQAWLQTSHFL